MSPDRAADRDRSAEPARPPAGRHNRSVQPRHAAPSDVSPAATHVVSEVVTGQDLEQRQAELTELNARMTRISECVAGFARLEAETAEKQSPQASSSHLRRLGSSGRVGELFPLSEAR